MYFAIYAVVVFAGLAMTIREGLWSNTILLINIITSGLVAFAFYSPLAIMLDEQFDGSLTYAIDYAVVWALFVVSILILKAVTKAASSTRLRFRHPIDAVGGPLVGVIAAWVLASFVTATLHMAPMPKDAFGGKLVHSAGDVAGKSSLTSPDLGWLRFVERVSAVTSLGSPDTNRFSALGFVAAYMAHREKLNKGNVAIFSVRRS
jgi:hypothetical protein